MNPKTPSTSWIEIQPNHRFTPALKSKLNQLILTLLIIFWVAASITPMPDLTLSSRIGSKVILRIFEVKFMDFRGNKFLSNTTCWLENLREIQLLWKPVENFPERADVCIISIWSTKYDIIGWTLCAHKKRDKRRESAWDRNRIKDIEKKI